MYPLDDLPSQLSEASKRRQSVAVQRRNREFLCGPVPMWWLTKAGMLPGKSLAVGVALWFSKGVKRSWTVPARRSLLQRFGVGRGAANRCLRELEDAGLIKVEWPPGRCPIVTIIDDLLM